jgi:hypothetical protein
MTPRALQALTLDCFAAAEIRVDPHLKEPASSPPT